MSLTNTFQEHSVKRTQFELEAQMQDMGYARFLKQLKAARDNEGESHTAHGRELIKCNMDDMVEAIGAFIKSQEKIRRKSTAALLLAPLNPEAVAYTALKVIINRLGHDKVKKTYVAMLIGRSLSNQITLDGLSKEKDKRGLVKHIQTSANRTIGNDDAKDKSVEDALVFFGISSAWSEEDALKVGATLVQTAVDLGLIDEALVGSGKLSYYELRPTAATVEIMEVMNLCPEFSPFFLPMVVEPAEWNEDGVGGYLTLRVPFVKTRFEGHAEALSGASLSSVRDSVNIIQKTAWRVHTGLLEVAQEAFRRKIAIDGLPFCYSDSRSKRTSLRVSSSTILSLANEFKEYEAIWFPHNMDWRGRVYPMVDGLSPQGNKLSKALLTFAEGKRIDASGGNFLAIHIANEFGKDKLSLVERVEWVFDNEDTILSVAKDPFGPNADFWINADSAWGFLRGCMEWSDYCDDPDGFLSTLPVALDGSCSGLQHFSAMFRDEVGGREVNLVAHLDRQDIYESVRKSVVGALEASEEPLASEWLQSGLLTRKLFKTPTMTYGYSSEVPGMTDQIKAAVLDTGSEAFSKDALFGACNFLAKITFSEIEKTVVKAAEAKDWLQSCVRGKKEATQWTTPDGMVVVQKYKVRQQKRLDIIVGEDRIRSAYSVQTDAVDTRKMASAIAPNVIHSLDAAHIRMVARAAASEQIDSLAMIHDSFGCHAANAGRFFNIIREQFVCLYDGPVAERLNQELSGGELPVPTVGKLDLHGVMDNDYAFS